LPENGNGSWPLQPEPVTAPPRPTPKIEPAPEEPAAWPLQPAAEAPTRPQRDTLAALADELSARPAPPRHRAPANTRVQPLEPRAEPRPEPRVEPRAEHRVESRPEPRPEPRVEQRAEPRPEPRVESHPEHRVEPRPEPRTEPRIPTIQAAPAEAASADQSLAEMAHRLEAALRKPSAPADTRETRAPVTPQRATPPGEQAAAPEPPPPPPPVPQPRAARPAEPKPARGEAKPSQGATIYDNLEQEMASLLGRPTKT
jgi:hypothetical protein